MKDTQIFPHGVHLTPHLPSEGWSEARIYWLPDPAESPFSKEQWELAELIRKRVKASRRLQWTWSEASRAPATVARAWMPAQDILYALSGLPETALRDASIDRRGRRTGDRGTEPRYRLKCGPVEVFARCEVVAAVVASAALARRPRAALTALSSRYLMEGRAILVRK